MKKEKRYAIGQKIPNYVKPFDKQELREYNFTAKHSSVLRILTKWSEYLEDIFKNANKYIRSRLYPFNNISN